MQACIDWFPAMFGDGVWMALGGAHYHYIREIPINTPYEIRMSIGGWEDKWVCRFCDFSREIYINFACLVGVDVPCCEIRITP